MASSKPTPILVLYYCTKGQGREEYTNNIKSIQRIVEDSGINDEYYAFVIPVIDVDSHIQVFYEKDFTKVKYDELKKMINDKLKEIEPSIRGSFFGGIFKK